MVHGIHHPWVIITYILTIPSTESWRGEEVRGVELSKCMISTFAGRCKMRAWSSVGGFELLYRRLEDRWRDGRKYWVEDLRRVCQVVVRYLRLTRRWYMLEKGRGIWKMFRKLLLLTYQDSLYLIQKSQLCWEQKKSRDQNLLKWGRYMKNYQIRVTYLVLNFFMKFFFEISSHDMLKNYVIR